MDILIQLKILNCCMPDIQPRHGCGIEEYDLIIADQIIIVFMCGFFFGGGVMFMTF